MKFFTHYREAAGLTQEELADLMGQYRWFNEKTGKRYDRTRISLLENGKVDIKLKEAVLMAQAFQMKGVECNLDMLAKEICPEEPYFRNLRNGSESIMKKHIKITDPKGELLKQTEKAFLGAGYKIENLPNDHIVFGPSGLWKGQHQILPDILRVLKKEDLPNNNIVIGSSGSGKTYSFIIPEILRALEKENNVFFTLNRSENTEKIISIAKESGYKIKHISFPYKEINSEPLDKDTLCNVLFDITDAPQRDDGFFMAAENLLIKATIKKNDGRRGVVIQHRNLCGNTS